MANRSDLTTDVLVVGSGPIGATYARLLATAGRKVTVIDSGAQLSARPGEHLANAFHYQQLPNMFNDQILATLEPFSTPRSLFPLFHRRTEPRINFDNPEQKRLLNMPLASAVYAVGGMGTVWTACAPAPESMERTPLVPEADWQRIVPIAQKLLNVHTDAFEPSLVNTAVKQKLQAKGYPVENLPMAAEKRTLADPFAHFVTWTGADTVLGPLVDFPEQYQDTFQILPQHRAEALKQNGQRIEYALVRDLTTYATRRIYADTVIVAGGPFLTPRLLWQSNIRYYALGRYLNDNVQATAKVRLSNDILQILRDMPGNPAAGKSIPIAWHDAEPQCGFSPSEKRPWHGQVHRAGRVFFYTARHDVRDYLSLTWYGMVEPRERNRITFSDRYLDRFGQPQITIDFRWSKQDLIQAVKMWWDMVRAARALGPFAGVPIVTPPGSTLHFQSTCRMGDDEKQDERTSVVDTYSKVWGFDNLYLGGIGVIPNKMASNPTLTACALAARSVSKILDCSIDDLSREIGQQSAMTYATTATV
ncbi:MAG TPA: GMC oxidoreductase [Anaerolineae bacterium]